MTVYIAEHFTDWQQRADSDHVALSLQQPSAAPDNVSFYVSFR